MDPAERALLGATVQDAVARAAGAGPAAVDAALAELGWLEMLDAEPRDAVAIVFGALGTTNAAATVLDDVVAAALGATPGAGLAVVLPAYAGWTAPGRLHGAHVVAAGLATARVATAPATGLLVVCGDGPPREVVTLPVAAATVAPVRGIDPEGGLHTVHLDGTGSGGAAVPLDPAPLDPAPLDTPPLDLGAWDAAVAAGRRAVAHQILGATRSMLGLARDHALERVQFGRPVAEFQAVRHRLAETLVAIEALEATLTAAWDEPGPMTAALAKAVAGRTARTVAAHCQQVLAGIGFTVEHPFHRFLKRTMALEGLFGATDSIVVDVGRRVLEARTVPTLIEL